MSEQQVVKNLRIVVFRVGKELYGLDISYVKEIIKLQEITEIPDTEDYVKGVINLRGNIVPVVSLERRLAMHEGIYDKKTRAIIVNLNDYEVGMIVNEVFKVITVQPDFLEPAPEEMTGKGECFFEMVYKAEEGIVGMVNLELLFGSCEAE